MTEETPEPVETWGVEKQNPEEETWNVHKDGYLSKDEAIAVCDVLAEIYYRMSWRVTRDA